MCPTAVHGLPATSRVLNSSRTGAVSRHSRSGSDCPQCQALHACGTCTCSLARLFGRGSCRAETCAVHAVTSHASQRSQERWPSEAAYENTREAFAGKTKPSCGFVAGFVLPCCAAPCCVVLCCAVPLQFSAQLALEQGSLEPPGRAPHPSNRIPLSLWPLQPHHLSTHHLEGSTPCPRRWQQTATRRLTPSRPCAATLAMSLTDLRPRRGRRLRRRSSRGWQSGSKRTHPKVRARDASQTHGRLQHGGDAAIAARGVRAS